MKITMFRAMDYCVGIPLCFIFSCIRKIMKIFSAPKNHYPAVQKVLFIQFVEMGSAILAHRALEVLKKKYPQVDVYFWIFEENAAPLHLLKSIPADHLIMVRSNNFFTLFFDIIKTLITVRKIHCDTVIDLELFLRYSSILCYLSGAHRRIGFHRFCMEGLYRGDLHTHNVMYNHYRHVSENFLNLVDAINEPVDDTPLLKINRTYDTYTLPHVVTVNDDNRLLQSTLCDINPSDSETIVINPGLDDRLPIRCWPRDNYIQLVRQLCASTSVNVILIGKRHMPPSYAAQFKDALNLVNQLSIYDLISLFSHASMLISHDCGILHLASMTPIHIIGLFGPETPSLYAPLSHNKRIFYKSFQCSPCLSAYNHRRTECRNNKCMQGITVNEVFEYCVHHLNKKSAVVR